MIYNSLALVVILVCRHVLLKKCEARSRAGNKAKSRNGGQQRIADQSGRPTEYCNGVYTLHHNVTPPQCSQYSFKEMSSLQHQTFITALLSFMTISHQSEPIIQNRRMEKMPAIDKVLSLLEDDDDEDEYTLRMKLLHAAQPLDNLNQLPHRKTQSYNQDDDTVLANGFDMSLYSLKYAGCSAISTFSDSLAQDATAKTVSKTIENVVFRLCPRNTCYDWTVYGCLYDYGEYIIRLDTWMQLISTYREEKIYKYCQTCKQCSSIGGGNRTLLQLYDVGHSVPTSHSTREIVGEDENDKDEEKNDDGINCEYYSSACSDYMDTCEFIVQDPSAYSTYFTCTAVSADNGSSTVYLGPHCLSDKATIVIGVFADNQCSEYIGNSYDVQSLTGINFDLSNFYKTHCYSCEREVSTQLLTWIYTCVLMIKKKCIQKYVLCFI